MPTTTGGTPSRPQLWDIIKTSRIVFSYSQEEDDEGCSVIEKVGSQKGMLLLVR